MKFLCTVAFLLSLASVAFAREEAILARVTSYWAGEGSNYASTRQRLRAGHCAVDPDQFCPGAKLFSLMASVPRSTPDRQWLIAKPPVYPDERRANSRPLWSIDFLNEARGDGVDERTSRVHHPSNCSARISPRLDLAVADASKRPVSSRTGRVKPEKKTRSVMRQAGVRGVV